MTDHEDTRTLILQAALHSIALNGFHGTSMAKVAHAAKISAATIYHYFDGKDELIAELYKAIKGNLLRAVIAEQDESLPLPAQIRQIIRNLIQYLILHPQDAAFMEQFDRSPYNQVATQAELAPAFQRLMAVIDQAKQAQIIKDLPNEMLETFTTDIASSIARKHAAGVLNVTEALLDQAVDACWDAVRR